MTKDTQALLERARKVLQRADDEYELLAAPDGTVAIEMNLLRALIAQASLTPADEREIG